jgi:peptidoglycan LD-endopeptidase CwlK
MINAIIRDIDKLTPDTAVKCRLFIARSKAEGLDIFVTETWRSLMRQLWLWALGRTVPGVKRTWTKHSKHQDGLAFDIAFKGAVLYPDSNDPVWARLGLIAKSCGLDWGGHFKGVDSVHFENNGGSMNDEDGSKPIAVSKAAVVVDVVKKVAVPTLKSAKAAAVVSLVVAVLPTLAIVFPQISPFIGAINAVAKIFGYGV